MNDVLLATEVELYVETLTPQPFNTIGTQHWLERHQHLQKLNQQALVEAATAREEHVKEVLVTFGRLSVLVHDAIAINIWRYEVLPKLLQLEPAPKHTIVAYTVLYHETVCVSLLELALFHVNGCESLYDSAADLLDYCTGGASQLMVVRFKDVQTDVSSAADELRRHNNNMTYDIGLKCLTILRYLSEYLTRLPLDICTRLFGSYDTPVLLTELLLQKPWLDKGGGKRQYVSGKWHDWDGEQVCGSEAQIWLALHQLLLSETAAQHYEITETRRSQLSKLLMLLTPTVLDQIAPLVDLKMWLSHMCMGAAAAPQPFGAKLKPIIIVETVLDVKQSILNETQKKWKSIAEQQLAHIFCHDETTIFQIAQLLSDAYNTDLMEQFEPKSNSDGKHNVCEQCKQAANKRCSHCKQVWYCSRACQVAHWPEHKCIA